MKVIDIIKSKPVRWLLIGSIGIVGLLAAGTAPYASGSNEKVIQFPSDANFAAAADADMRAVLDPDTIYEGISINGIDVSGKTQDEAAAVFADDPHLAEPAFTLSFNVNGGRYFLNIADLSYSSDLPSVIDEAYGYARTSALTDEKAALTERYLAVQRLAAEPVDFKVSYTFDDASVTKAVRELLAPRETPAKDAEAVSFDTENLAFVFKDSVVGLELDIDKAVTDALTAIKAGDYGMEIPVGCTVTEPKVTSEFLRETLGLISSTTSETTDSSNRNTNIRLVCETLDGYVLQPGETFDFNQAVGKRTSDKGYESAGVIIGTTHTNAIGGGICQTSGTLFNSVMKADLQVNDRHPHTYPSSYLPVGQDATVSWGELNFKFTNNTDYPIAIHSYYSDLHVTFAIYGRPIEDGMKIELENVIYSDTAPGTIYMPDPTKPVGTVSTASSGHDAISAGCYKVFYKDGVEVRREYACSSYYMAVAKQVLVGVLAPDGLICALNTATGAVTAPPAVATPAPTVPAETAAPTEPTPETSLPTETAQDTLPPAVTPVTEAPAAITPDAAP